MVGIAGVGVARKRRRLSIWTPAQLTTALWLDADDASTITLNGGNVAQWDDKSGNARNATQATAASQPAYNPTGLNGKPVLTLDGINDGMTAPLVFSGNPSFTIYALWNTDQTTTESVFFNGLPLTGDGAGIGYNLSTKYNAFLYGVGEAGFNPSVAAYTPVIQGSTRNAATGGLTVNINGGSKGSGTFGAISIPTAGATTGIGNGAGFPVKGGVNEVIVADALLSILEQQRIEGYLAWKWGGIAQYRAWTPADIGTDLALWLDADDASTITLNGSTVSQWDDKSGNSRNATQATAASQPTYSATGLNGKPVLQFDGTSDFLSAGAVSLQNTGLNVFVVGNYTDNNYLIGKYDSLSNQREWLLSAGQSLVQENLNAFNVNTNAVGTAVSGTNIVEGIFTNGTQAQLWANGALLATAPQAVTSIEAGTAPLLIGKYQLIFSNSDVSEVVVSSSPITTIDRQRMEGYLAWKWGLVANLPVDHPYKSTAPTVAV